MSNTATDERLTAAALRAAYNEGYGDGQNAHADNEARYRGEKQLKLARSAMNWALKSGDDELSFGFAGLAWQALRTCPGNYLGERTLAVTEAACGQWTDRSFQRSTAGEALNLIEDDLKPFA